MQFSEAVEYLARYTNYERELRYPYDGWAMNLQRVRRLLDDIGAPDKNLKIVHIAGSKGKGSTAAMIESILRKAGYETGLYTSPHLLDFRERIMISGEMIGERRVARLTERMIPAMDFINHRLGIGELTYFEILTAMSLAAFEEAGTDIAVLETGLGGRYDATNVCMPLISVLTPISLEHTDILGDTIAKIAEEKSMIIKEGRTAVLAPQTADALAVFAARCKETGSKLVRTEDRYSWRLEREHVSGQWVDLLGARVLKEVFIPLVGDHQAMNAATALAAIDELGGLGFPVSDEAARAGLGTLTWPARFQLIGRSPDVVIDGAHNGASAAHLAQTVGRIYPGRRVILIIGLGGDKDVEGFGRELGPVTHTAIVTHSRAKKAVKFERIEAALGHGPKVFHRAGDVFEAIELALSLAAAEDVILVTGSFYVISELLEWKNLYPGRLSLS